MDDKIVKRSGPVIVRTGLEEVKKRNAPTACSFSVILS